jgi:hypothetical protein
VVAFVGCGDTFFCQHRANVPIIQPPTAPTI